MLGKKPPTAAELKKHKEVADSVPGLAQLMYFDEKMKYAPSKSKKTIIELEEI
jgi:hypothetical protein